MEASCSRKLRRCYSMLLGQAWSWGSDGGRSSAQRTYAGGWAARLTTGTNLVGDRLRRLDRETVPQLRQRLTTAESRIEELQLWRASAVAALQPSTVAPAEPIAEAVPANWATIGAFFPYVNSIRSRTHKVSIGYPEPPRAWRTVCGWAFGVSDVARPVLSSPACHKSICERCLKAEREQAKMRAKSSVLEVKEDTR